MQPSNDLNYIRQSPTVTWTPQPPKAPEDSFSNPLHVRIGQPPAKPHSFSPQQGNALSHEQDPRAYQPSQGTGQANCQEEYNSREPASCGWDLHHREPVQSNEEARYGGSNHVTRHGNQSQEGVGYYGRNEQGYYEGGREEEGGGEVGQEDDEYQKVSVRDIKQMFNKPDEKGSKAFSRVNQPQKIWTKPPTEGSISPGSYGASAPRPGQQSSLSQSKPATGSIHRGPPPSDDDYRKPFSPQSQSPFGQPLYDDEKQKHSASINKQGGSYAGIVQPALPAKVQPSKTGQKGAQKKKEFDPNQSAVYKILLEEEERKKNQPHQRDEEEEEEEEETPLRPAQGPPRQGRVTNHMQPPSPAQGSRLNELLERDAAQIATYKDKSKSAHQEPVTPYHDQRISYQESPRSPYHQLHRGPPSHGAPVAGQRQPNHFGGFDETAAASPNTQYVDGIPNSDF